MLPLQWETLKRLSKLTTHSPTESTTVCKSCPDPLACPALSLSPCGLFMGPSILACVYFWSNPDTFLATRSCQSQAAAITGQIAGCALAKQTENCIFYEYRTLAHVIHSPHTHTFTHTYVHTHADIDSKLSMSIYSGKCARKWQTATARASRVNRNQSQSQSQKPNAAAENETN